MAEEDLIFGKNRHFFGGIEPSNMQNFTAAIEGKHVKITAQLPADTVINGQTLCTVEGAVIRRNTTDYPKDEFDGEEVAIIKTSTTFVDSETSATGTYYYAAFPFTTQGVYNRNKANRTSVTPKKRDYLFGYDLVKSTSSPSGRVSYPDDVDNAGFTPAKMNFGGSFSYGDWNFAPGEKFMPRPCMLTYAGVVDHYLNPNDYRRKAEGGASKVADTSFGGNAMMEWPKIYIKRWEEGGVYHFRCSDTPQDESWECWSNYDRLNNQIDHFYTPIYFGSNVSNKLRSISGQANMVSQNATTEINYAKANGNDWYTEVLADRLLIQDLLVMMGKSTDGQTVYGQGGFRTTSAVNTGTMNSRGMFWGSNNGTDGVKVFGMEHFWGNLWRRTAGWMNVNGTQKVKLTRGTKDGSTASDYNTDGNGYKTVSGATPSGTSGGYISSMKTEGFGRIPVTASGSSSTFEADGLYYNNSGTRYAVVGGHWSNGLLCGPFCANLNNAPSYSASNVGAALSCKPLAMA